jgi:hypothetical protein
MYYENSSKKRSKFAIPYVIKRTWDDFWYEWYSVARPLIGSKLPQGWKTFRWQRLFNVIIVIIILCALVYVL